MADPRAQAVNRSRQRQRQIKRPASFTPGLRALDARAGKRMLRVAGNCWD